MSGNCPRCGIHYQRLHSHHCTFNDDTVMLAQLKKDKEHVEKRLDQERAESQKRVKESRDLHREEIERIENQHRERERLLLQQLEVANNHNAQLQQNVFALGQLPRNVTHTTNNILVLADPEKYKKYLDAQLESGLPALQKLIEGIPAENMNSPELVTKLVNEHLPQILRQDPKTKEVGELLAGEGRDVPEEIGALDDKNEPEMDKVAHEAEDVVIAVTAEAIAKKFSDTSAERIKHIINTGEDRPQN